MTSDRTSTFQRNLKLEALLKTLNASIAETRMTETAAVPLPPLFILGTPRSGTTYCMQWLAATGAFSYPSNLISRFWKAPYIGAICQEMFTNPEFDFRGEFADLSFHDPEQRSELGKTQGLLSPNEFWYFWRAIFPGDDDIGIDLSSATDSQFTEFTQKLHDFASVREKPVATKGMIVNHQLGPFAKGVPGALFLHLDRDPHASAWSLLRARERMHGDQNTWYSFKTPNRHDLTSLPAPQQVMGQIETIRNDLRQQLNDLPQDRWLSLDYAELCGDPEGSFEKLRALYAARGTSLDGANALAPAKVSRPDIPDDITRAFNGYLSR
ncbi:sulfotransferase [uncultured Roseovarius sp.]|uniref:sulfotransferase n=1 Tax=uncultured Roseovarius sp. TaxID=293344 RepID=UPI0026301D1D|nr:sulfotransferase [uncultured Roseovarius sp.]